MQDTAAFKKAAIDWVLTHGTSDSMSHSTSTALADLVVRGVDYDDSEMPDFRRVAINDGDSFNDATWGEAFATTVYPLDRDKTNWREGYTFHVGDDDIKRILISQMIAGVMAAATDGDAPWKAKASQREVERMERNRAAETERRRLLHEATEAKVAAKAEKARKIAEQGDYEKGLL